MEKDASLEEQENGHKITELLKDMTGTSPYRYTKEELLEIKELPISNERPECLSEKYDSDGVWDPEKWHASLYPSECSSPVEGYKKDYTEDRVPLKRRIADPRERVKEDDLEVVLSPQRRSFGGGCQGNAVSAPLSRRPVSPLDNKENENLRLGGPRRIGSGRIMAGRAFEREPRMEKDRERERDRDYKDKRFRRDFGDKRVFSERRRNDSYAEEEPEWFSGGPTSQSETIELTGFDDKILEDDKRRPKRSKKRPESLREAECNGGLAEEPELVRDSGADQEVPRSEVLPEQNAGEFDFNEFFNLEKTVPGLASMIEEVLGEGSVSASRFSRWFSSNVSPSGSHSSSLRSTPHEELERLAGLDPHSSSPSQGPTPYFTPIQSVERKDKVDILELLHKAKIDLKPLLSSLSANKARLQESSHTGVVLSLEEVEGGLKDLKVNAEPAQPRARTPAQTPTGGCGTPFMAEHLEQALTGGSVTGPRNRDPDMSAFNKLVSTMKASGTLPSHPKANASNKAEPALVPLSEPQVSAAQQKNIFQELLGAQTAPRAGSPSLLSSLLASPDGAPAPPAPGLLHPRGASPPLFSQRGPIQDYYMQPPTGFPVGAQTMMGEQIAEMRRSISPGPNSQQLRALSMALDQAELEAALAFQQDLALHPRTQYQQGYNKQVQDNKAYRNRQPRMNRSPGPIPPGRSSPGSAVTSVLSPSFMPTSVIKKMYESKEKSKEEPTSRPSSKEDTAVNSQEDSSSPSSFLEGVEGGGSQGGGVKACSTPVPAQNRHSKDQERPRPGSTGPHHTPTMLSPGPSSPFPRPVYPVPLLSHVPLVRGPPPQLHPSVVQRMLAQGIQPQQLPASLLQAGMFPPTVDLAQLQGLPPALLGQPLYPLGTAGHPLMAPRASAHVQLAVMQQQLQQQQAQTQLRAPLNPGGPQSQSHGPHRTNHSQRRGGSPPLGLAKWFGSDVLQQPLPSMPSTKVISVDELEFRQ
ncbi:eukaryotic translation initiation factor 4E transporter [Chanos chanos]|uniref:Eukaryotic translation initiation factor 4E transporter n=1 Tax=Chanos chanos TaxID=29144 RepID=A0A6J2VNY5_CHACN|nr:eukaryotic translation initiation factor 4E transporter [Chanos chanos]